MRTSWIITFAAFCGVVAFVYTLATGSVRGRGRGSAAATTEMSPISTTRQAANLPQDIPSLEELINSAERDRRTLTGLAHFELARLYFEADRPDDARRAWEDAARLRLVTANNRPNNPDHWFEAGWSLWKLGRIEEATPPLLEAERIYTLTPAEQRSDYHWHRLGWARRLLGQDQDAIIAWDRARDLVARRIADWNATELYNLACYCALVGEREAALTNLEKAVGAGWVDAARATHDDDLQSLRDEARFIEAVRRMREEPRIYRFGPG